jgi:hypothetical protein
MSAAPRHAKPRTSAIRIGAPAVAAATLAGVAAAFVSLHGGPAAPGPSRDKAAVTSAGSAFTTYQMTTAVHRDAAALEARAVRRAVLRTHLAGLAAARQQAARRQAQQAADQPPPSPGPSPSPSATATPSGGGDAASSALGVCIRNAEEGGSYAWGPGNGGGAYQFVLGTWETYGGAASEYGVAGAAYQNQIFDNAIAAGGASNWTDYDGC